jgi:preprotein translocase subunit SecD
MIMRATHLGEFALEMVRKAGISGLFLLCAHFTAASAAPLALEVASATANLDQYSGRPVISIVLAASSARAFGEFTTANVGRAAEVRIDGKAVMKPIVREPILGGTVMISGAFSIDEARNLASRLATGRAGVEVEAVAD